MHPWRAAIRWHREATAGRAWQRLQAAPYRPDWLTRDDPPTEGHDQPRARAELAVRKSGVSCVGERMPWRRRAARGQDLAGRVRIARGCRGRSAAVLRHRSTMAWYEVPWARQCRALRTAGDKDWPSACARPQAAARTGPVPRRQ